MFLRAGSDTWFKSGLGRSAFKSNIYRDLPLDFYLSGIDATNEYYHVCRKREGLFITPKFYMTHDAYMMFYHPSDHVANSIKKKPKRTTAWWSIIRNAITSKDYLKLNEVVRGSQELSALAGAKFLTSIFKHIAKKMKDASINNVTVSQFLHQGTDKDLENVISKAGGDLKDITREALSEAGSAVSAFSEAKEDAEEAINVVGGAGGRGYTHEALSVLSFLKNPDEFRKKVKILKLTAVMMRKIMPQIPTSLSHQQSVSLFGGVSGITRMFRESQIKDILPQELAILRANIPANIARAVFAYRILQKQAMVLERSATVKPVIFVDKSGSMAEEINYSDNVPKISIACGLALALYRKLNADVYLFDTEVEHVRPRDVVKYLLTLEARGGTDITEVLYEIARIGKKDRAYIVVSDGIDEVSYDAIELVKRKGLVQRIRFILVPPAWDRSWLRENFKYVYAHNVAEFISSSKKIVR